MGRWGDELYESDQSLDYMANITDWLQREIAYWMMPEKVNDSDHWLAQVLGVVEVMLLFEQQGKGSSIYLSDVSAMQRWRDSLLSVWDGDWQNQNPYGTKYPYNDPSYRQAQRAVVAALFERLESIARMWTHVASDSPDPEPPLTPLRKPLPYFSIWHWTNKYGDEIPKIAESVQYLFVYLKKEIIYWLSDEMRDEIVDFNATEVWVAADLLAFLSDAYHWTSGVSVAMVQTWREKTVDIWKDFLEGDRQEWDDADPLYLNVMQIFDRLEALAEQYPPFR